MTLGPRSLVQHRPSDANLNSKCYVRDVLISVEGRQATALLIKHNKGVKLYARFLYMVQSVDTSIFTTSSLHQWNLTGRVYWVSLWFGEYRNGNPYTLDRVLSYQVTKTPTLCVPCKVELRKDS